MRIVGEHVVAGMRDEMMSKQQIISLRYFSEGEIGRIMSRLINDANTVRIFLRQGLTQILVDTTSIIGALVVVFALNVKLATIAVAILPVAVVVGWFLGQYSQKSLQKDAFNACRINRQDTGRSLRHESHKIIRPGKEKLQLSSKVNKMKTLRQILGR